MSGQWVLCDPTVHTHFKRKTTSIRLYNCLIFYVFSLRLAPIAVTGPLETNHLPETGPALSAGLKHEWTTPSSLCRGERERLIKPVKSPVQVSLNRLFLHRWEISLTRLARLFGGKQKSSRYIRNYESNCQTKPSFYKEVKQHENK